jgi:hypothetical protein
MRLSQSSPVASRPRPGAMRPSRRHLLLAGAVGLGLPLGTSAPALAAPTAIGPDHWTKEFMTRREDREGFDVDDMDGWQKDNARFLIAVVKGHDLGEHEGLIVLSTAIVESWLYNYTPAVDHDSGGLFQQRPSAGWGSAHEVRHKRKAAEAFLGVGDHSEAPGLIQAVPDHAHADVGEAAQAVQQSAHPDRYGKQVDAAQDIWDRFHADVLPMSG